MTAGTMNFKYGYIELRANIPIKTGASPSFWLKGNNGGVDKSYVLARSSCTDYLTEIDVFEASSCFDNSTTPNLHKWFIGGTNTNYNKIVKGNQFK